MKCDNCTEKCPQEELACEIAKGRMYATYEVIRLQKELQAYKDAEEQGLLLRLPCKVGDTVYVIGSLSEFGVTEKIELEVFECVVNRITLNYKYGNTMQMDCKNHSSFGWSMNMKKFNELIFLTKEEAEQALAEMQGK